jgi:hypothetical protein
MMLIDGGQDKDGGRNIGMIVKVDLYCIMSELMSQK